ncbi:GTP-binding protein [Gaetbulibacter aquiaggeris]|uniref:GTP-binding protein n=1 Tax=Gaetbulibacter aquiaggeris TaxID=1735373 RepID=A0ABW7MPU9_9FLAO
MSTTNAIVLRPRFKIELPYHNEVVLKDFEIAKTSQKEYIVNRIDDHVFIKFPKQKQHFWSPQLHLEINEVDEKSSLLHGLYGPNPTVWTFFMFLHFMVAGLFIAFSIWAYTNWALKSSYALQVSLMLFMVIVWFALYFAGSIGKASSKNEMLELQEFMNKVLKPFS